MSRITPSIGTYGTFELKTPWVSNPGEKYTISAIQTLDEIVRSGIDPKVTIYQPAGLTNGVNGFSWAAEFEANPSILTLTGTNGNTIIIPDTYILSYPNQSTAEYARYFASIDLGIFPTTEDLNQLSIDLADLATSYSGQTATGSIFQLPLETQPTEQEHLAYENAKKYNRLDSITNAEEIELLRNENQSLRNSLAAVITRLRSVDPTFQ